MKMILGKKIGMTQIFSANGEIIPVTVIEAGPCCVIQVKTPEVDGYSAYKIGFIEQRKTKNISKPMLGVFKKANTPAFKVLREIPVETEIKVGDYIKADIFAVGDKVSVTGTSKGKGFQGVMKRHHFKGGPDTHGSMFNRAPGSIGASSFPSRVWRGMRMAGHMGASKSTVKNLTVVDVKPEQNIILVKGAVPGAENTILEIRKG